MNGWRCRQIAQDQTEGMMRSNLVVTVGDDEEGTQAADASSQEPQQFEGSAIGPVSILADHERRARPCAKGCENASEERVAGIAVKSVWLDLEAERGR